MPGHCCDEDIPFSVYIPVYFIFLVVVTVLGIMTAQGG